MNQTLLELMGIGQCCYLKQFEYAYGVLDTIDRKIISSLKAPVVRDLVELANFSSMLEICLEVVYAKSFRGTIQA